MATRHLLGDLVTALSASSGDADVSVESMGGVDAAKRVAGGEPFDGVVLASGAIDKLIAQGAVVAGSRVDLVRSPMAAAVRSGTPHPSIEVRSLAGVVPNARATTARYATWAGCSSSQ